MPPGLAQDGRPAARLPLSAAGAAGGAGEDEERAFGPERRGDGALGGGTGWASGVSAPFWLRGCVPPAGEGGSLRILQRSAESLGSARLRGSVRGARAAFGQEHTGGRASCLPPRIKAVRSPAPSPHPAHDARRADGVGPGAVPAVPRGARGGGWGQLPSPSSAQGLRFPRRGSALENPLRPAVPWEAARNYFKAVFLTIPALNKSGKREKKQSPGCITSRRKHASNRSF